MYDITSYIAMAVRSTGGHGEGGAAGTGAGAGTVRLPAAARTEGADRAGGAKDGREGPRTGVGIERRYLRHSRKSARI